MFFQTIHRDLQVEYDKLAAKKHRGTKYLLLINRPGWFCRDNETEYIGVNKTKLFLRVYLDFLDDTNSKRPLWKHNGESVDLVMYMLNFFRMMKMGGTVQRDAAGDIHLMLDKKLVPLAPEIYEQNKATIVKFIQDGDKIVFCKRFCQ
jgi:hypothetical protein